MFLGYLHYLNVASATAYMTLRNLFKSYIPPEDLVTK